jgi:hypothetical protein
VDYLDLVKHWRLLMVAEAEAKMMAKRWLVTCSCGWTRDCSSEWAAQSASRPHQRLGDATSIAVIQPPPV